jgi:hypothetical protein
MTKLIIFDKDGTLTQPISGGAFVQHPEDQQLRPGVAQKLEQLRAEGVAMAIASNQGGCAKLDFEASQLKTGMWWHTPKYGTTPWKITDIQSIDDRVCIFGDSEESDGGRWNATIANDEPCLASHKSIEEAIAEMKFAMGLTGINTAFFCPDMAGERCLWLDHEKVSDPIECRELGDSNAIDGLNCRPIVPNVARREFNRSRWGAILEAGAVPHGGRSARRSSRRSCRWVRLLLGGRLLWG